MAIALLYAALIFLPTAQLQEAVADDVQPIDVSDCPAPNSKVDVLFVIDLS